MDNSDRKSLGKLNGVSSALLDAHGKPQHNEPPRDAPKLNTNLSPADGALIAAIRNRAMDYAQQAPGAVIDWNQFVYDIMCVHLNGCALKLFALAHWSSTDDFLHDVLGIGLHIDRISGKLQNGFTPRYTERKEY